MNTRRMEKRDNKNTPKDRNSGEVFNSIVEARKVLDGV